MRRRLGMETLARYDAVLQGCTAQLLVFLAGLDTV